MKLILLCLLLARVAFAADAGPNLVVIRAGSLVDGRSRDVKRDQMIVVRGDRIESVSAWDAAKVPAGAKVADLSKATVLPGLVDAHTHVFLQEDDSPEGGYDVQLLKHGLAFRAARATASARRALEQGFTTIRDVETEGAGYGDVGIKQAIEKGYIPGPRMFVVTRAISTTGGYPLDDYAPEVTVPKGVQIGDGPVELRKVAREQLDNGADWLKVYMTHRSWVDKQGRLASHPTLTVEELRAVSDEAHSWGRKVACHAYGGEGLRRALEGGCDSIEHGLDLDDAAISRMGKQGTWYCPTMSVYYEGWGPEDTPLGKRDRKRAEVHEVSFKKALAAGLKIVFGTDVGGFSWEKPMAGEFAIMVRLGMKPMDAILSATSRAAEMLDQAGELGVVAPGAYADIIAVAGDPLADIRQLERVTVVMKGGRFAKGGPGE